ALQNDRLTWLGNVPSDALITLRKEGALHELRQVFTSGIADIEKADAKTYTTTVNGIIGSINEAFYKHMENIKKHSSAKKKFLGFDIAPFLVTGGISIAAASTGNIPLSLISATLGLTGVSNAKDIWKKGSDLLKEGKEINRSPVGILFEARDEKRR